MLLYFQGLTCGLILKLQIIYYWVLNFFQDHTISVFLAGLCQKLPVDADPRSLSYCNNCHYKHLAPILLFGSVPDILTQEISLLKLENEYLSLLKPGKSQRYTQISGDRNKSFQRATSVLCLFIQMF